MIKKLAIVKRAPIGYDEWMYYGTPTHARIKALREGPRGKVQVFFFFPGVAFVLEFLTLFCVIYLSLFVLFVLARTVFLGI